MYIPYQTNHYKIYANNDLLAEHGVVDVVSRKNNNRKSPLILPLPGMYKNQI
ncbi:MAG: hypothetical protein JEY91_14610 [Spirochaetaceae bacterium]|nr:hypothetical protein [Spirochaetaceae bacterium]